MRKLSIFILFICFILLTVKANENEVTFSLVFRTDASIESINFYRNGKKIATQKYGKTLDTIISTTGTIPDGTATGTIPDKDGKKGKTEIDFKNNKPHGFFRMYALESYGWHLVLETKYKNGKEVSTKVFDKNGKLFIESKTRRGKKTTRCYFEKGRLFYLFTSKNNVNDGKYEMYHENGNLSKSGQYKNGYEDGIWKTYHENGNLKDKGAYVNGKKDGIWKHYDESGRIKLKANWRNGNPYGNWKTFDIYGNVLKEFPGYQLTEEVDYMRKKGR